MILVRVLLKARAQSACTETARDGTKWKFMEFGLEAQKRRAAQILMSMS